MTTPKWPTTHHPLPPTPLSALLPALKPFLRANYHTYHLVVHPCPDLRLPPFNLAAPGLSGAPRIADVGGQAHLAPLPDRSKLYSLEDIAHAMQSPGAGGGPSGAECTILGAAAGPWDEVGVNSELMPNISWRTLADGTRVVANATRGARVGPAGECVCAPLDTGRCGLMANVFGCDGAPGDVLYVRVAGRVGRYASFTECVRAALQSHFGETQVSLGGVVLVKRGRVRMHVMPDFSSEPLENRAAVEGWLRFYEMRAPLVGLCTLHSVDAEGLGLRMEHTHAFSGHGEGGHYHGDIEGEEVEYEAWLNVAERIVRIDRPVV